MVAWDLSWLGELGVLPLQVSKGGRPFTMHRLPLLGVLLRTLGRRLGGSDDVWISGTPMRSSPRTPIFTNTDLQEPSHSST